MAKRSATITRPSLPLPVGYTSRPATMDDLDAVYRIFHDDEVALYGEPDTRREEIQTFWTGDEIDLPNDSLLVAAPDGQLVAYADLEQVQHARIFVTVRVHPSATGKGLGTTLLREMEVRAQKHIPLADPAARVTLNAGASSLNYAA